MLQNNVQRYPRISNNPQVVSVESLESSDEMYFVAFLLTQYLIISSKFYRIVTVPYFVLVYKNHAKMVNKMWHSFHFERKYENQCILQIKQMLTVQYYGIILKGELFVIIKSSKTNNYLFYRLLKFFLNNWWRVTLGYNTAFHDSIIN